MKFNKKKVKIYFKHYREIFVPLYKNMKIEKHV